MKPREVLFLIPGVLRLFAGRKQICLVCWLLGAAASVCAQQPVNKNAGWTSEWTQNTSPSVDLGAVQRSQFVRAVEKDNRQEALRIAAQWTVDQPDNPEAWHAYATGALWSKKWSLAETACTRELSFKTINPEYRAEAHVMRGRACNKLKKYREAVSDFRAAVRENPNSERLNVLAWTLATCPAPEARNGAEAVRAASKAVALNPVHPYYADTLAAAYAEAGDFKKAVAWQKKARALATPSQPLPHGAARQKDYEKQQPYRDVD